MKWFVERTGGYSWWNYQMWYGETYSYFRVTFLVTTTPEDLYHVSCFEVIRQGHHIELQQNPRHCGFDVFHLSIAELLPAFQEYIENRHFSPMDMLAKDLDHELPISLAT